ncbi:MAG: hypothetical protein NVS3B24_02060 [Candidatus Dormibacteria bacterium]
MQETGVSWGLQEDAFHRRSAGPYGPGQRDKLGDRSPVHIDPKMLTGFHPTQHLGRVITQVSRRYLSHATTVSQLLRSGLSNGSEKETLSKGHLASGPQGRMLVGLHLVVT